MTTIKVDDEVVASLHREARPDEYYTDTIKRVLEQGTRRKSDGTIGFGDVVEVKAIAHRVIREDPLNDRYGDKDESKYPVLYHGRGENISREVGETGNWPPRDGKDYARMCREVLSVPTYGIIVGKTLRIEGRPVGEHDEYGYTGWLEDRHPVRVYEVALTAGWERKARVVLVLVDDVEKLDKRIEELTNVTATRIAT